MIDVFDFVKDLSYKKEGIMNEDTKDAYIPYLVNKAFSYYVDTIFQAQKMNMAPNLSPEMQYAFYFGAIRKKYRYTPWHKRNKEEMAELKAIGRYCHYSINKAREARPYIPDDIVKALVEQYKDE